MRSLRPEWNRALIFRILILPALATAFLITDPAFQYQSVAHAQEVRERRSIIDMIFGGRKKRVIRTTTPSVTRVKRPRRKKPVSDSDPAGTGAEVEVAKQPDAKKVLVVGDFMGSALADGLIVAFASDPGIVIEKKTDGSSGLVRDDHLDWPQTLATYIGEVKPALVVIMLGANDRQQMVVNGKREKFQTELWKSEYEKRVAAIIASGWPTRSCGRSGGGSRITARALAARWERIPGQLEGGLRGSCASVRRTSPPSRRVLRHARTGAECACRRSSVASIRTRSGTARPRARKRRAISHATTPPKE